MTNAKLLIAEISYRKLNFALSLLAVMIAAGLFVAAPVIVQGYGEQSTRIVTEMNEDTEAELVEMQKAAAVELAVLDKKTKRIMRDLGFNLRIMHKKTDLSQFYLNFQAYDMPEEYLQRLANSPILTKVVHLVPSIRNTIQWEGRKRLLVGYAPEATQTHIEKKAPMGFVIKPGTVYLGHESAVGHKLGETITIAERSFKIAKILPETADEQAVTIFMNLKDAQAVLGKEGKISEILALGCKCTTMNRISEIREQLEQVLPDTKITEWHSKAEAREKQRDLVANTRKREMAKYEQDRRTIVSNASEKREEHRSTMATFGNVVRPLAVIVSAAFVALMTWVNVRERRTEIGLLRALGRRTGNIAGLILGKAVVLGLLGGALGCAAGLAVAWGVSSMMRIEHPSLFGESSAVLLSATLLGAPLISALAAYLPTRAAIQQDPAVVLMEQ